MTEADCERIEKQIEALSETVHALQVSTVERLKSLETKVENERSMCPYREDIARASNNTQRLELVEAKIESVKVSLHELDIALARSNVAAGAAGGGVFSVVGAVVFAIGKTAGWW
ncbi:MAG: hypothetical protein LLG44_12870 [Chloroflexi bacterium]|nr:hypothetical protein [Chloroflexota bacterium]